MPTWLPSAGIVLGDHEDGCQLCRDQLTGLDVRLDGWDIRGRWFGVVENRRCPESL